MRTLQASKAPFRNPKGKLLPFQFCLLGQRKARSGLAHGTQEADVRLPYIDVRLPPPIYELIATSMSIPRNAGRMVVQYQTCESQKVLWILEKRPDRRGPEGHRSIRVLSTLISECRILVFLWCFGPLVQILKGPCKGEGSAWSRLYFAQHPMLLAKTS